MTTELPTHGQLGEMHVYDRTDGNVHTRCVGREKWCSKCQQWVSHSGPVSMLFSAFGCPKCMTPWEAPAVADTGSTPAQVPTRKESAKQ